jgi:hypothetical protein
MYIEFMQRIIILGFYCMEIRKPKISFGPNSSDTAHTHTLFLPLFPSQLGLPDWAT